MSDKWPYIYACTIMALWSIGVMVAATLLHRKVRRHKRTNHKLTMEVIDLKVALSGVTGPPGKRKQRKQNEPPALYVIKELP